MAASSAEYEKQIAEVRGSMESKIIELRERSRVQVRRHARTALLVVAGAVAVGAAVGAGVVVYRMSRPASPRERLRRVLPDRVWDYLHDGRRTFELGLRRQVPPVRLYVGDRQVGEEPPASSFEKIVVKAAQAAGTAAAAAVVSRLVAQVQNRGKAA